MSEHDTTHVDVVVVGAGLADLTAARTLAQKGYDVADLEVLLGPKATSPREYVDHAWSSDRWSRGGYSGIIPPGTLTAVGAELREPVGRLHWAGTETAHQWPGYMEGAVASGHRVTTEIRD